MRDGAKRDSVVGAGKALSWWQTLYHGMDGGDCDAMIRSPAATKHTASLMPP